jgi:hypothetical protein
MLRAGAARPHVLTVTMPGGTAVRLAAEEELRRRGWPAAMTPADADVLLVAGDPAAPFAGVLAETWQAMPAPRAACRAGFWPQPAVSTWPMITSSTAAASMPARATASRMAIAPSSAARSDDSAPMNFPIGVRTALTMTASTMVILRGAGD